MIIFDRLLCRILCRRHDDRRRVNRQFVSFAGGNDELSKDIIIILIGWSHSRFRRRHARASRAVARRQFAGSLLILVCRDGTSVRQ